MPNYVSVPDKHPSLQPPQSLQQVQKMAASVRSLDEKLFSPKIQVSCANRLQTSLQAARIASLQARFIFIIVASMVRINSISLEV
jgi:hypothetical protein